MPLAPLSREKLNCSSSLLFKGQQESLRTDIAYNADNEDIAENADIAEHVDNANNADKIYF